MTLRFLIFKSRERKTWLCVVAARDKRHALTIARRIFYLSRSAFALEETWLERGMA